MILERLVVGPLASNCYIVGSEVTREGMVVDPGDEAEQILSKINDLQLDIKLIVLTHGHVDHIGAVKDVCKATGAEICVHTDDAQSLKGWRMSSMLGSFYPAPPPPDRLLKGEDKINIGDLHFLVLHTPGHTSGGICLLGHGVVFTGDTLFKYGIGRTDLLGGSQHQLLTSLHTKLMVLTDNTIVYPGHGPESTIGTERSGNPYLRS